MTRSRLLTSAIGPAIARFVEHKQALGCGYTSQRAGLARFDRFLARGGHSDLTAESFAAWCSSIEHLSSRGRRMVMLLVRQFCLHRRRTEPTCFVPDPSQFPPPHARRRPHVFSEDQIDRLLRAADALRPWAVSPLYPQVARLAVTLLYTSGLRRGELARLTLGDYDAAERVLLVRDSKFHKSRLIPLSEDGAAEIGRYLERRRGSRFPCGAQAALLIHRHTGPFTGYTAESVSRLTRHLFRAAGVRTDAGRLPRVHDLRFTFAFHALLRWYRRGADVQARLPALATYMGHASILSTHYYLPTLDVVAPEACERFARHCAAFLATADDAGGGR